MLEKCIRLAKRQLARLSLRNTDFVIISNNCWGAEIYKYYNKPYNSPFVGLFLFGPDYIKLLENFNYYLNMELKFASSSKWIKTLPKYPVGLLGEIEIHFMHYKSEGEAKEKWCRRIARMTTIDSDKFYFKICERDLVTSDLIRKFHSLPFKNKISFSTESIEGLPASANHIIVQEKEPEGDKLIDGAELGKITYRYVNLTNWIKYQKFNKNLLNF